MKIKVSSSYSGKISSGEYQNIQPYFAAEIECEWPETEDPYEIIEAEQSRLHELCKQNFNLVADKIRLDKIKKDRADFHFYTAPNGKEYPSVTSILNYDTNFTISEEELKQYAAQGTIIHKQVEEFIKSGEWKQPSDIPELTPYIFIIKSGNLGLSLDGWDFPAFVEKFKLADLRVGESGTSNQYEYGGLPDFYCRYEGKNTLVDVKRTPEKVKNFSQIAAYAKLDNAFLVEQMMIAVINDKTERGFSKPIIESRIDHYFEIFVFKRKQFRTVYGL